MINVSKEEKETKSIILQIFSKNWKLLVVIGVALVTIVILPYIGDIYYSVVLHTKVDSMKINLSRSELLKIYLSLIGPILTYRVFKNTLEIQQENREKYEADKKAGIDRKNIDDANREFYNLLELFSKQQSVVKKEKIFEKLYSNAIYNDSGNDFINDYGYIPIPVLGNSIIRTMRSEGPKFEEEKPYEPSLGNKVTKEDTSLKIINEQYKSVYSSLGPYFKILHRILKSLNKRLDNNTLESDDYYNYIGILRAQISSEEFMVILINALFIERGVGLGIELVGSNFFGNERDFRVNQHFDMPIKKVGIDELKPFTKSGGENDLRRDLRLKLEKTIIAENGRKTSNFDKLFKNHSIAH